MTSAIFPQCPEATEITDVSGGRGMRKRVFQKCDFRKPSNVQCSQGDADFAECGKYHPLRGRCVFRNLPQGAVERGAPAPLGKMFDLNIKQPPGGDPMTRTPLPKHFKIDKQEYRLVGTQDHYTTDGRYLELVVYQAVCAHPGCRRLFRYKTTKTCFRRHQVNRRCEQHKMPGVPVPMKRPKRAPNTRPMKRSPNYPEASKSVVQPSYLD